MKINLYSNELARLLLTVCVGANQFERFWDVKHIRFFPPFCQSLLFAWNSLKSNTFLHLKIRSMYTIF